ncbi:MAG TPA: carboxypeptidase regulatory-like domain-containing protein [Thermoanaerobaculia bacterium]
MVVCAFALVPVTVQAQATTGNLAGSVVSAGDALPGVSIEAVHVPTGTRYADVTDATGRFLIPNVRVGGPYTVTATLEGFRPGEAGSITVPLGGTAEVAITMALATVSEAITVTATADEVINPNRTGSSSAVSTQEIESLPTVNRQIQDFARTNPYFNTSLTGDGTFMFVAGRNNRYNNIQIDGAVNNDLFGLSASGTPGGGSGTQPISLDAIEQIQLLISPYDVRQSGFTGGGVNAVTRSGTNDFHGSVFGTKRNENYVGEDLAGRKIGQFDQTQYGGRIGGPILRDRLFFFFSGESNDRDDPNGTSADGSTTISFGGTPSAADVANVLNTTYGYDPGGLGDLIFNTKSTLLFGRLDANLGSSNNLTLRHNYVDANQLNPPSSFTRNATRFYFPNNTYLFPSETNSTVLQLNTIFSANAYNEGRIGYQTIREHRETPGEIFPTVEIGGGERSGVLQAGIERFSGANALNQDILEITNDFTYVWGNHNFVIGTHNEMFEFANLFISDFYGYYHFPNLAALQAGTPDIYRIGFATGSDPRRATQFEAAQYSLYASDQWRVGNGVTLTLGLRADKPHFATTPSFNPLVQTEIGYSTADIPSENITWEPRFGFNWDIGSAGKQQLRGGIGVFQGRTPFVWISNNYGGTGIEQISRGCTTAACMPAFNPDPNAQPRNLGSGSTVDIALSDPDFQFPRVLRATLGYDRELFFGIRGTAEVLWSKTQQDVFYQNVNKRQTGTSPLDGRPTYANISTQIGNAFFLTNTTEGNEVTESLQLEKRFTSGMLNNLTLSGSYAHQEAESVGEGTSSTASSNWQFGFVTRGDIFNPEVTTSTFQVEHRFNIATTYNLATGPLAHNFGLFYVAQSGQPYSLLLAGDPNRDGSQNNDLLYIPADLILCPSNATLAPTAAGPCRATISGQQTVVNPIDKTLFTNFLNSVGMEPGSGETPERNSLRQPWTRRLDFHYELGLPEFFSSRVSLQADILNVLNLFDDEAGIQRFVLNNTYQPVAYSGIDPTTNLPVYREAASGRLTPGNQYSTGNLASRWQGRLGLRVTF